MTPSDAEQCLNGTETCKSCLSSDCNKKPTFHECYSCNSKDDPGCAREIQSGKTEVCKTYNSDCITGIDGEGYTHRGCNIALSASDILQGYFNLYDKCSDNKCNTEVFPNNRQKCYQCNGEESCNFVSPNSTNVNLQPQPCSVLSDFNQCYTYINEGNIV